MRLLRTLFIFLCFVPTPAFPSLHEVREIHYQMGTFLELTLWHSEDRAAKRLIREAVGEVHRLEEILSNFDPQSDVSRFNNLGGYGKANLHPDLYALLKIALTFSAKTNGYFDVTVGPLVDLWKEFLALGLLPSPEVVAERLGAVGYGKLKLYDDGKGEFLAPDMKIDLGGIGKGYAVDRVADFLKRAAVTAALINFGGSSIYALGTPPDKRGWDIGIQGTDGKLRGVILLHDMGLSTSGSMGQFWTIAGNKYGHIINPKNGMPVNESRMATVISPSATAAEALTKPLGILGSGALSMTKEIPQSEAVVIPESGPLFFSSRFRSKTTWRELPAT